MQKKTVPRGAKLVIYQATNRNTGKIYIGKAKLGMSHAKSRHHQRAKFRWKYGCDGYFYSSIRKHGWGAFDWEVIDQVETYDELDPREIAWIAFTRSYLDKSVGYNMTPGGDGGAGRTLSARQIEGLRERFSGEGNVCWGKFGADHPAYGHVKSVEGRAAISRALTGRTLSQDTRRKLSLSRIVLTAESKAETAKRKEEERVAKRTETARRKAAGEYKGENAGPSKVSDAQRAEICLRRAAGESYRSISEDFPLGLTGVRAVAKDWGPLNGFPFEKIVAHSDHRSKLTDDQRREIIGRHRNGDTITKLAEAFEVGATTIYWTISEWRPRNDLPYVRLSGSWVG
ncbi:hypothetical protein [Citreimonas salinaria]|uniref:GIY-YIG domain-containing protein n=1 Tax=Citreimonas salinaria TaxID=321339 RepID=A0A1H3M1M8_9RHOB|nr:hypothetical protein [Citreimonas salinaria]SDY70194.1 hypothetical protein SAMN05444340_11539 [Citreimonas salinaria]